MKKEDHKFMIVARDKDCTFALLDHAGIPYIKAKQGSTKLFGKFIYYIKTVFFYIKLSLKFKPDLIFSFGSPYAAVLSFLIQKPHIVFDDTDYNPIIQFLYKPFSKAIIVPSCFQSKKGRKHISVNTYLELAYLHPAYFKPDNTIFQILNLDPGNFYIVVRFVSWKAVHDIGKQGISNDQKKYIIKKLSEYARVYISSEVPVPIEIQNYIHPIQPHLMHNLLANASLYYGESPTMAAEAAVLGIPSVYVSNSKRGYVDELTNKYQLIFSYSNSKKDIEFSIQKSIEILKTSDIKNNWQQKRYKMLSEKTDLTKFLTWFINNFPESFKIMKKNPNNQQLMTFINTK